MKNRLLLPFILAACTFAPANVSAKSVGQMSTLTCNSDAKTLNETGGYIRIMGYCSSVTVNGTGNMIVVDRVGVIVLNGTGNSFSYLALNPAAKGKKASHPLQRAKGIGNLIQWTNGKVPPAPGQSTDSEDSSDEE